MPPYQSYYQPQINQPIYPNYNQPVQPNIDRMASLQQYQQNLQQQSFGLNGKIVDDFGLITGNDVPMDGIGAIFLKSDGTEIQHRVWNATNGSIVTTSYKPVIEQSESEKINTSQINLNLLNEDMRALREEILGKLDSLEQSWTKSSTKTTKSLTKAKKEEE